MAFSEVCPDRLDMIHQRFRRLCVLLLDADEWGQIAMMTLLLRYARTQFVDPNLGVRPNVRARGKGEGAPPPSGGTHASRQRGARCAPALCRTDTPGGGRRGSRGQGPRVLLGRRRRQRQERQGQGKGGHQQRLRHGPGPPAAPDVHRAPTEQSQRRCTWHEGLGLGLGGERNRDTVGARPHRAGWGCQRPVRALHQVVMAVAMIYWHLAPRAEVGRVVKPLVRLLGVHREIDYAVLANIATMVATRPVRLHGPREGGRGGREKERRTAQATDARPPFPAPPKKPLPHFPTVAVPLRPCARSGCLSRT